MAFDTTFDNTFDVTTDEVQQGFDSTFDSTFESFTIVEGQEIFIGDSLNLSDEIGDLVINLNVEELLNLSDEVGIAVIFTESDSVEFQESVQALTLMRVVDELNFSDDIGELLANLVVEDSIEFEDLLVPIADLLVQIADTIEFEDSISPLILMRVIDELSLTDDLTEIITDVSVEDSVEFQDSLFSFDVDGREITDIKVQFKNTKIKIKFRSIKL